MIHVFLSQEVFLPGDEVKVAVTAESTSRNLDIGLRFCGYLKCPNWKKANIPADIVIRSLKSDPSIPLDSVVFTLSQLLPMIVQGDDDIEFRGLFKLFLPFFLVPSFRGKLFDVSYFFELSIFHQGSKTTKRIPLHVSASQVCRPKLIFPKISNEPGCEEFDFTRHPFNQRTPHGIRSSVWRANSAHLQEDSPLSSCRSRRSFKISVNKRHATEISIQGDWASGSVIFATEGDLIPVFMKFECVDVKCSGVFVRLVRVEKIGEQEDESIVNQNYYHLSNELVDLAIDISIPLSITSSFDISEFPIAVMYKLDFEFEAILTGKSSEHQVDSVTWALPLTIRSIDSQEKPTLPQPLPALSLGQLPPTFNVNENDSVTHRVQGLVECEIDGIIAMSLLDPGSMRFSLALSSK